MTTSVLLTLDFCLNSWPVPSILILDDTECEASDSEMRNQESAFDSIDYRIIEELHRDARKPASEIGRQLGVNERTVRNRIDRLVRLGAIRLTAIVDPSAFGYVNTVDIFLEVDPAAEAAAINRLMAMPQVTYVAYGNGTRDVSIEARFKDIGEMSHFLGRVLPAVPGVKVKGYALVPRILRNIDEWMPKECDFSGEEQDS